MRRNWTTHVSKIRHRTLDRWMTLCVGQNDKDAQNIQNLKCHDGNECWWKTGNGQRRARTVGKTDRHLKKSTTARSEGMHWHL